LDSPSLLTYGDSGLLDTPYKHTGTVEFSRAITTCRVVPRQCIFLHIDRLTGGNINRGAITFDPLTWMKPLEFQFAILHFGQRHTGHYITVRKRGSDFLLYDNKVDMVTISSLNDVSFDTSVVLIGYTV
jgi:hypothetical protein